MHQTVENTVQIARNFFKPLPQHFHGRAPDAAVGVVEIFAKHGQRQLLAAEAKGFLAYQSVVFGDEPALFHKVGYDLLVHRFKGQFVYFRDVGIYDFQRLVYVGIGEKSTVQLGDRGRERGRIFVVIFLFFQIKFVARIQRKSYIAQRGHGLYFDGLRYAFVSYFGHFAAACRRGHAAGKSAHFFRHRGKIDSFVFHFSDFHTNILPHLSANVNQCPKCD